MKFWYTDLSKDTGSPWFATHLDFGACSVDCSSRNLKFWRIKLFLKAAQNNRFNLLREFNLHFLVPFYFSQEDYRNGRQLLLVWRWGRSRWELWDHEPNYDSSFLDALERKGATKSELYDRIKFSGDLKLVTTDWKIARGAR
jgi:hypothetical protein